MPFKILFNFILILVTMLFANPPQPQLKSRGFDPSEDDFDDLETDYQERGLTNIFEKFVDFVKKINPFRHFALFVLIKNLPKSEAELNDTDRASIIEYIASRIPDPQDAQEVLSNIFDLINTARKLAIGLGIKKHEPEHV